MIELHTEDRRLADVFARDESHVEALHRVAEAIVRGLGSVQASTATTTARNTARLLVFQLQRVEEDLAAQVSAHRLADAEYRASFTPERAGRVVLNTVDDRGDDGHTMVNVFGAELPPELEPFASRTGGHGPFVPRHVLAKYATGQPLPDTDDGGEEG